jgi:crotonobetainyl-CoA:carnitine CoA-transferase CaiB-like acyl-CoA transferase
MGEPAWATDAGLATMAGRLARVDELERRLAEWTAGQEARALAERLQAAGVEAGPVEDFGDLHEDPQLAHRRHFREVEHAVLGRHPVETHAMRFSALEARIHSAAPRLGEHTEHVLRELLGMGGEEFVRLADAGVLE